MLLKQINDATGVDTSNLTTKGDFCVLRADVGKLNIKNLVNVSSGLNDLKTKVDDMNVDTLETVPLNLKKMK